MGFEVRDPEAARSAVEGPAVRRERHTDSGEQQVLRLRARPTRKERESENRAGAPPRMTPQ